MRNERIGNDISIAWEIKSGDNNPFPLEGKNVALYLHHPYGKQKVEGYRLEGNKVIWTFKGADQKYVGKHGLTLVVNEGANGMITTDSCDFVNLVSCSCQVGGEDNDGVQTEAIELTSTLGIIAYDDTEIREELSRLETNKADKSELTELSAEVGKKQDTISDLETIRSGAAKGATAIQEVKTINGQSIVGSGNIEIQGGGGASNEWKCVYDGRMEVGANEWVFSTYADGTPLKAEEVVVQVIMDNDTTKTTQAYVRVQSSTNKSETYYGAFFVENPNNSGFIAMSQVRLKASPFIMVAEMYDNLPLKVAQGVNCVGRLGKDVYQIYEDITLVRIFTTTKIAEAAPLLKIYAR